MIYIDDHIDDFELQQALAEVSPQRREHTLRYRQERDQRLSVAAYRLLQRALQIEYGIDDKLPQFVYNANGKPFLQEHPEIHFSLSHCRLAVACAVSDQPLGIDIETIDHYSPDVATHVMNAHEMQQITSSSHPDRAFTRLWTMKESYYKLTGDDHGGDVAHMLDNTADYEFTTVQQSQFVWTCCQKKQSKE